MSRIAAPGDHVIVAVVFEPRAKDGPLLCTCGWWGASSTFAAHREAHHARQTANGYARRNQYSYDSVGPDGTWV